MIRPGDNNAPNIIRQEQPRTEEQIRKRTDKKTGRKSITNTGRMMHGGGYRQQCTCGIESWKILIMNCVLDGEAYDITC